MACCVCAGAPRPMGLGKIGYRALGARKCPLMGALGASTGEGGRFCSQTRVQAELPLDLSEPQSAHQ